MLNSSSKFFGPGIITSALAYGGYDTTSTEVSVIESILKLQGTQPSDIASGMRHSLIDSLT